MATLSQDFVEKLPDAPPELVARLKAGSVSRLEISKIMGITKGISAFVDRIARKEEVEHLYVHDRHGIRNEVRFHIRPRKPGEPARRIIIKR